jgi:DhnA family fructose-bisphosphate aldolase class Ia
MKNRLARIFNPQSGRTVMLAIDHGYFQGPTTGLERVDVNILPIVPYADTLMLTRGILRSIVPPSTQKPIVLRVSGGTSILKELSNEEIAVDIEESIRLNVCAMAVQVFIGGEQRWWILAPAMESRLSPSRRWAKIWTAMPVTSGWQPEFVQNWVLITLKLTMSKKTLKPCAPPARCPL